MNSHTYQKGEDLYHKETDNYLGTFLSYGTDFIKSSREKHGHPVRVYINISPFGSTAYHKSLVYSKLEIIKEML